MKKSVICKKLLSALLSLAMLAALPIPMSASAEEEDYTNLALKKAITATESYSPPEGFFGLNQLVDGIWETFSAIGDTLGWNCDPNAPNSQDTPIDIDIDLDCVCWTDKMVLKPMQWANGKGFPKALELQVSTDGETWTTVAAESDIDASAPSNTEVQPRVYTFEKVSLRYARIHISLRSDDVESTGTGMHNAAIGEWEIWGAVQTFTGSDLEVAIREAEAIDNSAYALSTVTVLQNAVAAARALLEDSNATSGDYSLAEEAIRAAIAGLLPRGESVNLALHVAAECANSYTPPEGFYDLAFLTDGEWQGIEGGNIRLGWHTNPFEPLAEEDTVDIVVPLGTLCTVEQVVLKPMKWSFGQTFPQDFEIQVSLDGTQWKTVASETGADARVPDQGNQAADSLAVQARTYDFDPVQAQYIRLHITRQGRVQDATGSCLTALGELEVYGYMDGGEVLPVTLNKTSLRMNPGETDWLSLDADKRLPTPVVTYRSQDEAVVTVDADGTVHAQACGETDILVIDETNGSVY
ncbi:MAG: discoidin domain-containing protein, partial [Eubacteriales bacterium]